MINEENLAILKNYENITTKELLNLNISKYDINKLITQNKLKRVKKGVYEVINETPFSALILDNLHQSKINEALSLLHEYLVNINKENLESLLTNMIKRENLFGTHYKFSTLLLRDLSDKNLIDFAFNVKKNVIDSAINNNNASLIINWSKIIIDLQKLNLLTLNEKEKSKINGWLNEKNKNSYLKQKISKALNNENKNQAMFIISNYLEENNLIKYEELFKAYLNVSTNINHYKHIKIFFEEFNENNIEKLALNSLDSFFDNVVLNRIESAKKWINIIKEYLNLGCLRQEDLDNYFNKVKFPIFTVYIDINNLEWLEKNFKSIINVFDKDINELFGPSLQKNLNYKLNHLFNHILRLYEEVILNKNQEKEKEIIKIVNLLLNAEELNSKSRFENFINAKVEKIMANMDCYHFSNAQNNLRFLEQIIADFTIDEPTLQEIHNRLIEKVDKMIIDCKNALNNFNLKKLAKKFENINLLKNSTLINENVKIRLDYEMHNIYLISLKEYAMSRRGRENDTSIAYEKLFEFLEAKLNISIEEREKLIKEIVDELRKQEELKVNSINSLKNIEDLYNKKGIITTKELIEAGYNQLMIKELVETNILNRIHRGFYEINPMDLYISNLRWKVKNNDFYNYLHAYLVSNKKAEYEKLILSIIKLDLYNNCVSLERTHKILNDFSIVNIKNTALEYFAKFKKCLNFYNIKKATIYYDVVLNFIKLGYLDISVEKLDDMLSKKKEDTETLKKIIIKTKSTDDLCIISTMNYDTLSGMKDLIYQDNSTLEFLFFDYENQYYLVLHNLKENVRKNGFEILKQARRLYDNKKYEESLALFKQLSIRYFSNLGQMAQVCLKLNKREEALKYLKIATYNSAWSSDFGNIIKNLDNDSKLIPDIQLDEVFNNKLDIYPELITYFNNNNLSIDEVCKVFNLSDEEVTIIKLQMIKDYYANQLYDAGDILLNELEANAKEDNIIEMIYDIKAYRRSYKDVIKNKVRLRINI